MELCPQKQWTGRLMVFEIVLWSKGITGSLRKCQGSAVTGQFVSGGNISNCKEIQRKGTFNHGNLKGVMVLRPLIAFVPLDRIVSK